MSAVLTTFNLLAICQKFSASPKVMELASQYAKPSEFIAQLRANNFGQEAVQALSRMMPKEKAVAWAEQSARMAGEKAGLSAEEVKALDAAKAWSTHPSEKARAAAATAARKLPADSPAMWTANATAFSQPMPLPEGAVPLPQADDLTAQMAAGSVQLSAAKVSPAGIPTIPPPPEMSIVPEIPQMPEVPKLSEIPKLPEVPKPEQVAMAKLEEMTTEQRAQITKQLDPFLEMGVKIVQLLPGWS
jgi:hypothetical protein